MKRLLATALLGVLAITGCSDSPEEALAAFCDAHDELVTAAQGLGSLSVESTSDEVDAVRTDVESSWETYEAAAEEVGQDLKTQAEAAYADYRNAISVIPGDAPLEDRVNMTIDAANAFQDDLNTIVESTTCE